MTDESIQTTDNTDFDKVLADIKWFTEWNEEANKQQAADNQHLIEVLDKINDLDSWDLWKKDITNIFQIFWKNFKIYLKANTTPEQLNSIRNELEHMIDSMTFDDRELEEQINNLYITIWSTTEPNIQDIETTETNKDSDEIQTWWDSKKDNENTEPEIPNTDNEWEAQKDNTEEDENITKEEEKENDRTMAKEYKSQEEVESQEEKTEEIEKVIEEKIEEEKVENKKEEDDEEGKKPATQSIPDKKKESTETKASSETDTKKAKVDTVKNIEYLKKHIADKNFPWKDYLINIIKTKKSEDIKLLQLQLIPYYDWHIDWSFSSATLTAIENYIDKNLNKQWENILKNNDPSVIRCDSKWNITNKAENLNTVIKTIGDKNLWHAYFLDYENFEYSIDNNSKLRATINDYNYVYDISKDTLQKQKWEDPEQDVTNEHALQWHFNTIVTIAKQH